MADLRRYTMCCCQVLMDLFGEIGVSHTGVELQYVFFLSGALARGSTRVSGSSVYHGISHYFLKLSLAEYH